MDQWHGILMGACGSLATAVGVLWRAYLKQVRRNELQAAETNDLHETHVADVKALSQQVIELSRVATYAPPLQQPKPLPPA